MSDFDKMSDEELLNMASQEGVDTSDLDSMSDEQLVSTAESEGVPLESPVEQPVQEESFIESIPERVGAAATAATESFSFGFMDNIVAGAETLAHMKWQAGRFTNFQQVGLEFENNKKSFNKEVNRLKRKYPIESAIGSGAGIMAQFAVLPGAATATTARTVATSAALGATRTALDKGGISGKEDLEDVAVNSLIEGGAALAGPVVSQGLKGVRGLSRYASFNSMGAVKSKGKALIKNLLKKTGQTSDEFISLVQKSKTSEGKPLMSAGQDMLDLADKSRNVKNIAAKEIDSAVSKADKLYNKPVSGDDMVGDIRSSILDDLYSTGEAESTKVARQLEQWATRTFRTADGSAARELSIKDLHNIRIQLERRITERARQGSNALGDYEKTKIASILRTKVKDLVGKADETGELLTEFTTANKKWASMDTVSRIADDAMDSVDAGALGAVKNMLNYRTFMLAGAGAASGHTVVGATAAILDAGLRNPTMASLVAKPLTTVSKALASNPEKWGHIASRLSVSAAISSQELSEAITASDSEIMLNANPIGRTTAEVMQKQDDILTLGRFYQIPRIDELEKAIKRNDSQVIGEIMDAFSKVPEASNIIEPGMGWDGKVFSAGDIEALETSINQDASLTPRQRMGMLEQLMGEGRIPQAPVQPEPDRVVKNIKRNTEGRKKREF
jgi:hypothetical protein